MFNFLKRKGRLSCELCETVKKRAVDIMRKDNNEVHMESVNYIPYFDYITGNDAIDNYETTIDDVIAFAEEYGCTVDYLLGRTDTPYYTL